MEGAIYYACEKNLLQSRLLAMNNKTFDLQIGGSVQSPESIGVSDLSAFVPHLEKAIAAYSHQQEAPLESESPLMSLVGVQPGSCVYTFSLIASAAILFTNLSEDLAQKRFMSMPRNAHEAIYEIHRFAEKKHWSVSVSHTLPGAPTWSISKDEPVMAPNRSTIQEKTHLYGHCERVGGASKPKVSLRLRNGNRVSIQVSREVAKELGKRLYCEVRLEGTASWDVHTWELVDFKVDQLYVDYQEMDAVSAFQALADAAKGNWANVNATDYVNRLRNE